MLLQDMLLDRGCAVIGPTGAVGSAISLIEASGQGLDGAFLDNNLRREMVYPVADALLSRAVPFVFITGYGKHQIDQCYALIRALPKPFPSATIDGVVRGFEDHRRARQIR